MKQYLEYFVVRSILTITSFFPNKAIYALFKYISIIFYYTNKKRRVLCEENIKRAFNKLSCEEVKKLSIETFISVSRSISEVLMMINDKLDPDSMIKNKDDLLNYFKSNNVGRKPTIFITAHYGNWELIAKVAAKNGYPLLVISRKGDNLLIENKISKPFRLKYGNKNAYKKQAMIAMIKHLKNNGSVAILIDQSSNHIEGVKTKFFNKDVYSVSSIANIKLKYNPTILPIFAKRCKDGKYEAIMYNEIKYSADELENKSDKIVALTQKYNEILQEAIELEPTMWFWMHDRWKIKKDAIKGCS